VADEISVFSSWIISLNNNIILLLWCKDICISIMNIIESRLSWAIKQQPDGLIDINARNIYIYKAAWAIITFTFLWYLNTYRHGKFINKDGNGLVDSHFLLFHIRACNYKSNRMENIHECMQKHATEAVATQHPRECILHTKESSITGRCGNGKLTMLWCYLLSSPHSLSLYSLINCCCF